jgi:ArsR family transcriptional regulator, arsenate/arsenite/antimonite-responsive transcriptional repressor
MVYAELMQGFSDQTRLRIMALLAQTGCELCVCQIVFALGESQYKISRHLRILRQVGWLRERKAGRWVHYNLGPQSQDVFGSKILTALLELPPSYIDLKHSLTEIKRFSASKICGG